MSYYVTLNPRTFQISEIYINKDFHRFPNVAIIRLADPFVPNLPINNPTWGTWGNSDSSSIGSSSSGFSSSGHSSSGFSSNGHSSSGHSSSGHSSSGFRSIGSSSSGKKKGKTITRCTDMPAVVQVFTKNEF